MSNPADTDLRQEANDVALALGIAMGQWGLVENRIFLLYAAFCRSQDLPDAHSVVYESMVHLETKLTAVDRLAKFRLADEVALADWATLLNKVRRKTKNVRNKIAHWRIWYDSDNRRAFLGPPLFMHPSKTPDFGASHTGAMSAQDLLGHAKRFTELADEIETFIQTHVRTASR